jgi:hypothetical protein
MIQTVIDKRRVYCGRCRCYGWRKIEPRLGRWTPMWAARFVWWLSLKGPVGLVLAEPLTWLLWRKRCLSCMIIDPVNPILADQYGPAWWGESRRRNTFTRPPEALTKVR